MIGRITDPFARRCEPGLRFTPTFFLEVLIAVFPRFCRGAVYGAIRADLTNLRREHDAEVKLRQEHAAADDESFHDIRDDIGMVSNRVAVIEGRMERP
jgi:hypothetical protein